MSLVYVYGVAATTVSICDNASMFNGFQRSNKILALNNNCITITRHNKSLIYNINPLKWLNNGIIMIRNIYVPSWVAGEIIVHFFSVRDKIVSGIVLVRKDL